MTLRAIVLLALAAFAVHEARDVVGTDDHASAGHHALIALPALLSIVLATILRRPLFGAATALVRGVLRAPRAPQAPPRTFLVVPGLRAVIGRGPVRDQAGRSPPALG